MITHPVILHPSLERCNRTCHSRRCTLVRILIGLVERRGFEPLTSTMRTLRATKVSVLYPRSTHQRFKPANQERLIKDYTILKAIRTAPCSEKRQMTIPDVSCIPIKEPIDCFQAKRLFRTGSSQTFTLSLPSSASACLKSSNVRKK